MLHSCGIALCSLCQSEAASGEVWLVLCPLCFSGSLLFGYRESSILINRPVDEMSWSSTHNGKGCLLDNAIEDVKFTLQFVGDWSTF